MKVTADHHPGQTSVTLRRRATGSASTSPWAGPAPAAPACWSGRPARTWTVSVDAGIAYLVSDLPDLEGTPDAGRLRR